MLRSHLKEELHKITDKILFPESLEEKENLHGTFNKIYFYKPPLDIRIALENKEETTPTELVYSDCKQSNFSPYNIQLLLKSKQVCMDFIIPYFFVSQEGLKISPKATQDLFYFTKSYSRQLNAPGLRGLFAQILLAVHSLHICHLVHRDIKLENFLVYECNDFAFLRLADLDSIMEVKSDGTSHESGYVVPGTEYYKAPELYEKKLASHTNFFKLDAFSTGTTFQLLLQHLIKFEPGKYYLFQKLIADLTSPNPHKRLSIEQAMQSQLFGKTPEQRSNYFSTLRTNNRKLHFLIDGKKVTPLSQPDNLYWLLPNTIKLIAQPLGKVAEEMESYMETLNHKENISSLFQELEKQATLFATAPMALHTAYQADLIEIKLALVSQALEKTLKEYNIISSMTVSSPTLFKQKKKDPRVIALENFYAIFQRESYPLKLLKDFLTSDSKECEEDSELKTILMKNLLSLPTDVLAEIGLSKPSVEIKKCA